MQLRKYPHSKKSRIGTYLVNFISQENGYDSIVEYHEAMKVIGSSFVIHEKLIHDNHLTKATKKIIFKSNKK